MSSPVTKKQKTMGSSSEVSEQQMQQISQEEQQVSGIDLCCDEKDMIDELGRDDDEDVKHVAQVETTRLDYVLDLDEAPQFTRFLLSKQLVRTTRTTAIDTQTRASAIDRMLASHKATQYPNAIYLAVSIFDQYFASSNQASLNPQTVIDLGLFLAVKYEYGLAKLKRVEFSTGDLDMEFQILRAINYRLVAPTTKTFLDLFLTLTKAEPTFGFLCSFITELSLLDPECSVLDPSLLAAASVFLAEFVLRPDQRPSKIAPWDYAIDHLRNAVRLLHDTLLGRRHQHFVFTRTKYTSPHFGSVASLPCRDSIPEEYYLA